MKIKCIKIYDENKEEYKEKSSWVTIGREYIVLAIELRLDKVSFLIASDANEQPILQNACQFKVLTKTIPTNWQFIEGEIELLTIGPKKWGEPGFWDSCYDGNSEALEIYRFEARIIIDEEGVLQVGAV